MCDGTLLPHCGHLLSCEACQRFAAFRVRNRIFDVLRFGTPIEGIRKAGNQEKTNGASHNFSLSNALQSDFRLAFCSSVLTCLALQTRSPSLSQWGCTGKFSNRS